MIRSCAFTFTLLLFLAVAADAATCDPDGVQRSGSIYRICMPAAADYNGMLVIWAHGFQDAGTPVEIPAGQLCASGFCIDDLVVGLGFAFATNSYSKTGLAVLQGEADILDLAHIFAAAKGEPRQVYLVGASEGGLITALAVERHPELFSAGLAACGPLGDFQFQINYFGDARATFDYFFPGVLPGNPFNPDKALVDVWTNYYDQIVRPFVLDPVNRHQLDQWVAVARLPFDAGNYLATVEQSMRDVLRYSMVNLADAAATLGGFPFDNRTRWYSGSDNDVLLNVVVPRVGADARAVVAMRTAYRTTGILQRPLITLHTLRDQQVPYVHEDLYNLKTLRSGSFLIRHANVQVDRYGHCNFTKDEALLGFAAMLLYAGTLQEVIGTNSTLKGAAFALWSQTAVW
jgi:pimeloyl-ACP methyl ester carboxylesterase